MCMTNVREVISTCRIALAVFLNKCRRLTVRKVSMEYAFILLLCCLTLQQFASVLAGGTEDVSAGHSHSRTRRNLVFQDGAIIQFIFGFGIPVTLLDQSMTMGVVMKFIYQLPTNATVFTNPYSVLQKRSTQNNTRWDMYSKLEATVDRMDLDGRACVLRTICEAADTTLRHNGLLGELFHVLLTPSTTTEKHRSYLDREYLAAERLGTEISGSCHLLYPECKTGLLDIISELEY